MRKHGCACCAAKTWVRIVSALLINIVTSAGSGAQALQQPSAPDAAPGAAPDAANDASPFAMLLAAITAADPDLQAAIQPDPQQSSPISSAATPLPVPQQPPSNGASNSIGADGSQAAISAGQDQSSQTANVTPIPSPVPDEPTAPKATGKPDKKAEDNKTVTDAAPDTAPPPNPALWVLQAPVPPVAVQAIASHDGHGDLDDHASATAIEATSDARPAQSPVVPDAKLAAPGQNLQPPPSQLPQAGSDGKSTLAAPAAQDMLAVDDGTDDGGDDVATDMATAGRNLPATHAGAKPDPLRTATSKQAVPPGAGPQNPAVADDDAGTDTPASNAGPMATMPSQAVAKGLQIASQNVPAAVPQQAPAKLDPVAPTNAAADNVANVTPQPVNAAAAAKDRIQNFDPTSTASSNNDGDSKPAHGAPAVAPQPDTQPSAAPQSPAHPTPDTALPQTATAIGIGNANMPSGLTVAVHVANHGSDPQETPAPTPNTDGIAVSIAARSLSGAKQFDIRLDPPELGRVEVRLSIDASGKTQAHMTTDQPQTLELLQKDAPNLTRALRDAGLDVSQNGLNFSLKGQQQNGQNNNFGAPSRSLSLPAMAQSIEAVQSAATLPSLSGNARLDIHV